MAQKTKKTKYQAFDELFENVQHITAMDEEGQTDLQLRLVNNLMIVRNDTNHITFEILDAIENIVLLAYEIRAEHQDNEVQ